MLSASLCSPSRSWPKTFKNHLVGEAVGSPPLGLCPHRPGQQRQAKNMPRSQRRQSRQIGNPIGHKMWPRRQGRDEISHAVAHPGWHQIPIWMRPVFGCNDAANKLRGLLPQPCELARIERHWRDRSGIGTEHSRDTGRQAAIAVEAAFQLHQHGDAAADEVAQVAQGHHVLGAATKRNALEFRGSVGVEPATAFGQAAEDVVMVYHGLAVARKLDIDFDAIVGVERCAHRARGIFDQAACSVVEPAVGDRAGDQPIERVRHVQDTSNVPSTSTAASAGSTATPTVVRACRPLSPNVATIRSEAPFMTFGPSRKSGAELMKPPSRTTRTTLSRSPSAALTCARRLTAQARAALCPLSIETPPPSFPVAASLPSPSKQSCPDTMSMFPVRTNGT